MIFRIFWNAALVWGRLVLRGMFFLVVLEVLDASLSRFFSF